MYSLEFGFFHSNYVCEIVLCCGLDLQLVPFLCRLGRVPLYGWTMVGSTVLSLMDVSAVSRFWLL